MDYSTFIQDFVDGSLDSGKEEELFHALSGNDVLRTELKHELAIKDSIRNDTKAYTPSVESTKKIFAAVGFNPPPPLVNIPTPSPNTGVFHFLMKFRQGIISSVVGAAIAAAILLMLTPDTTNNNNNASAVVSSQNFSKTVENYNPIAVTESKEIPVKPQIITKTVYKPIYVYVPAEKKENSAEVTPAHNTINTNQGLILPNKSPLQTTNALSYSNYKIPNYSLNDFASLTIFPNIFNSNTHTSKADKLNIALELLGSQYWYNQNASINPHQSARFNNNSLGIFYNFNETFSLGLEMRQENFFQIYEGKDSIGNRYRYEQQPNFTSYALGFKFKPISIFEDFYPSIQFKLGGNNAGFVGRGALGLEYSPFSSLSFLMNAEYSALRFKHQGNLYWSPKFGLNYGISYKF
jgi:hypothetical protein